MPTNSILPDTCAWIDFFRGKDSPLTVAVEQSLLHAETVTCGVVVMELLQGVKSSREESLILNAFQALTHLEMTRDLWIKAGKLAARMRQQGQILPLSDIIIAVTALEYGCAVLTIDRHFETIPGLTVIKDAP
jgi:predicted nucleic acid-binding protein